MLNAFSPLTQSQLIYVEDQLSNNEASSDEELIQSFIAEGLSEEQAKSALTYRLRYLSNIYRHDRTPIRSPKSVLRFNPHSGLFEPEQE
ncbi:hypothetical protein KHO49_17510 [Pseudomonas sp. RC4D1]|uniref:Uncharacterized protein n=1 Tax=Pseudomonas idahonensis TaxID=2942628 RepID=A0ABT5QEW6_9PSED|nr:MULTISPECIES: hypothetical protein [Pseudomonas]MBS7560139.1 hypothetical protein [Pseudomonas sp. RC4D1]MDD1152713.1 hypothetical protein [Pseudomonas idahonensis]